jgi:pimeloyl-ACP methyl ester carboxylesterase
VSSSYIFANQIRFHYLHWNRDGEGQVVVLLHDLGQNARIWEPSANTLTRRGFTLLALDLRGHGLSDKPDEKYNIEVYLRDLAACFEALNLEKPVLVGHGWGALLALEYAARFPVGPRSPAGIALVDGGFASPLSWQVDLRNGVFSQPDGASLEGFLAKLPSLLGGWTPDEHIITLILGSYDIHEGEHALSSDGAGSSDEYGERIYARMSGKQLLELNRAAREYPLIDRYKKLFCRALLVVARPPLTTFPDVQDRLAAIEQGVAQVRQHISDLQVEWVDDSIHDLPLQRPDELAGILSKWIEE